MPNPSPKLENLTSYKPKWKSGKTRTIRVPVAIAERVLEAARKIDEGKSLDTSEYVNFDASTEASKYEIKKLKQKIEELEKKLISVTSDKDRTLSNSEPATNSNSINITDTSELFDEEKVRAVISEGLSCHSKLGGKIKISLAQLGNLLGFEIKNVKKKWIMVDTSELSGMEEIKTIISEGLSTSSKYGSRIKTSIAQIGNLLGFKIERKGQGGKWIFTDTNN